MTKNKRFIQKNETIINTMTDELVTAGSEDSAEIIVDWLNKIFDKNGELSKENYGLQDGLDFYREQNAYLSEENEQLKQYNEEEIKFISDINGIYRSALLDLEYDMKKLEEENKQLKKDRFICLDCKYCGYTEIGCLCEKQDHWEDFKNECNNFKELKYYSGDAE